MNDFFIVFSLIEFIYAKNRIHTSIIYFKNVQKISKKMLNNTFYLKKLKSYLYISNKSMRRKISETVAKICGQYHNLRHILHYRQEIFQVKIS